MPSTTPLHLHPTAEVAPRALLPGDPGRALALAQLLIEKPLMLNHNRGLWGYTGKAHADGLPLTIQSTGMGGPSAAIVLEELASLGVRSAIRVGTCGALERGLRLGDLVLAREAIAADGVGGLLAGGRVCADCALSDALSAAAKPEAEGVIATTDLFYEPAASGREDAWRAEGALAIEMEAAALFAVGARAKAQIACLLAVSDVFPSGVRERISNERLQASAARMGEAAVRALAGV